MSAAEVIEQIEKLTPKEREKVSDFLRKLEQAEKRDQTKPKVSEEFKRAADEVFTTNAELFRKLAK